jgi:hypothetical protein
MAMRRTYAIRVAIQGRITQQVKFFRYVGYSRTTHETNTDQRESIRKYIKRKGIIISASTRPEIQLTQMSNTFLYMAGKTWS